MGILRADRITGLGGANAIKGSVEFRAAQNIQAEIVNGNADFNYGSGDFTIECWWNSGGDLSTDINFVTLWNYASDRQAWGMYWDADDGNFGLIASTGGSIGSTDITFRQAANFEKNRWYHLAIVRISNTLTLYKDGTSIGSNSSFTASIYENTVDPLIIGGQMNGTDESAKIMRGFLSNLRIIKGEGIYTGNFTPPTSELTVTPNTVLLACQSPGDILHEATGKTLVAYRKTTNDAFPVASRFTPNSPDGFSTTSDVGTQFGSTFDGVTTFDSQAYMVPPGGNTRERNRGRGVLGGGDSQNTRVGFIDIQSQGNANEFGQLTFGRLGMSACASSTRILFCGGYDAPTNTNIIDFFTIATTSNATDFGDSSITDHEHCALSNQTRGLIIGGTGPSVTIDFVTIAQTGNASDFGDLTSTRRGASGGASPTRGLFCGSASPQASAQIDFVTIATTGNSADFGDLTVNRGRAGSVSSSVRTVIAGGYTPSSPNLSNTIDFVTIATTGDATDFGDLSFTASQMNNGMSNNSRGVFVVTGNPSAVNNLEFITIATTGDASDFGDAHQADLRSTSGSDSHGGLS